MSDNVQSNEHDNTERILYVPSAYVGSDTMIRGRLPLYLVLMEHFHDNEEFTPKQAYVHQKKNCAPLNAYGYVYSNMLGELHRFVQEGRARKVRRGVYALTPKPADKERYEHRVRREPMLLTASDRTRSFTIGSATYTSPIDEFVTVAEYNKRRRAKNKKYLDKNPQFKGIRSINQGCIGDA